MSCRLPVLLKERLPKPMLTVTASDAHLLAHNLRRIMAREGMTYEDVIAATGLDERTIRGIARGTTRTQARTLHRLADGLGVMVDDLFAPPAGMSAGDFDVATNPAINETVSEHPDLFEGWSPHDFQELASRFGVGGQLNEAGVREAAVAMNTDRELLTKAHLVLESDQRHLLAELILLLHDRARMQD